MTSLKKFVFSQHSIKLWMVLLLWVGLLLLTVGCDGKISVPAATPTEGAAVTTQSDSVLNTFPTATSAPDQPATDVPPAATEQPVATDTPIPAAPDTPVPTKTTKPPKPTKPPKATEPATAIPSATTDLGEGAKAIIKTRNKPTATSTVASATATRPAPTATQIRPTATNTWTPPTATHTATWTPPTATNTPQPPTATRRPPTATATWTPPTATNTPRPPTATATRRPPTVTATQMPPTATSTMLPATATPAQPVTPLDFNHFITACEYQEGDWRCDMTIAPSGGSGQGYIINVYDSDPPATYETNGNQNHSVLGRRCFAWVQRIEIIDAGTQELFAKDVYIDPNAPPVSDFLGGACTMP